MSEKDEKNFGFEKVSSKEKRTLVDGVFSDVAGKYDLMNDLMNTTLEQYSQECRRLENCKLLSYPP